MHIRITQQALLQQSVRYAQQRTQSIGTLQAQVASGLRVTRPSDDPGVYGSLLAHKAAHARMDVDLENISAARLKLNQSVSHLIDASNLLTRAREIGLSAVQSQNRETLAQEVDALIDHLLDISNRQEGGVQIFSGTSSQAPAFEVATQSPDGLPQEIQYVGSSIRSQVAIGPKTFVDTIYSGKEIFQSRRRATTEFSGATGAAAGTGTDSAVGSGTLTVRHTTTTYSGGGVAPDASSPSGDSIIGSHTLTIEDHPSLGRVARLNEGGPTPFDATSVDLQVEDQRGHVVFVDFSGVPPGFTGSIAITADGTISVDGGITEQAINFSSNQTLVDAQTGRVTNVDSTNIRRTGTEHIEYVGTHGAFESLIALRDLLRSDDPRTTPELQQEIDYRLADLGRVQDQILEVVAEQSVSLENLEDLELRTQELQLDTAEAIGEAENTDMPAAILQLQNEQNLLQFIYAAAGRLFDNSLLPFLQ